MQLKSYLDNNSSFKDEVVKLAFEVKSRNMSKEFYHHSVKSIVEKYSAYYSRKYGKAVDPEQISEITDISTAAALKVAFSDESFSNLVSSKVSYEEISKTVDEYFDKKIDGNKELVDNQELNDDAIYHEVESNEAEDGIESDLDTNRKFLDDGDVHAQDANINHQRQTAF
jgi:hypothetical protein